MKKIGKNDLNLGNHTVVNLNEISGASTEFTVTCTVDGNTCKTCDSIEQCIETADKNCMRTVKCPQTYAEDTCNVTISQAVLCCEPDTKAMCKPEQPSKDICPIETNPPECEIPFLSEDNNCHVEETLNNLCG